MRLRKSFGLNKTIFFEKPHKCIYKQISSVTQCRLDLVRKVFFLVTSKKAFFYRFRFFYDASELWRKPKLQFFAPKKPQWVETNSYFVMSLLCFPEINLELYHNFTIRTRVSVQGVESLWVDCKFIPADWGW